MTLPPWLDDPDLAPVWRRLRASFIRDARTCRLTDLDRATRHALGPVLGQPVTGTITLVLAELDEQLLGRAGISLGQVIGHTTGALPDREADAARRAPLELLAAVDTDWAARVRTAGLLTRQPDPLRVVHQVLAVRAALRPGEPRLRTELAAAITGDAHALDDGRPLTALLLRAFTDTPPASPAQRRELWERHGVLSDSVSTSVLTLGLRPVADGPRERALAAAADLGDPVLLTPWQLRRLEPACPADRRVLVVENPAVLEAIATRHGGRFPVVCTAGWPSAVAVALLSRLAAPLAYHGDFDWRGLEVCDWLSRRVGAEPWRMTSADYLAAAGGDELHGRPVGSPWDPSLATAMITRGVAVHEEQILDALIEAWSRENSKSPQV